MIDVNKLLGKEPTEVNKEQISTFLKGKRVLVTGAVGSIGSELVRQICEYEPSEVIFLDRNEEKAFYFLIEIRNKFPDLKISCALGSITDWKRVDLVFNQYKPEIIFHTAANKHVPLSEDNPHETFMNNVGGTINLVGAAIRHKCESFVFISTDKAVNPTSVMGHTKRLCELYIQSIGDKYSTCFTIVRFGNVIGSSGSMLEIFEKQLPTGQITVTDPEMTRYFLTIPDACKLLIQAGAFYEDALFILDMGEPYSIVDIAQKVIDQSGLEAKIVFTGIRPGEKVKEELFTLGEGIYPTSHSSISIMKKHHYDFPLSNFQDIVLLENECNYLTNQELKQRIKEI